MAAVSAVGIALFPPQSFGFRSGANGRDIEAHLVERTTLLNLLLLTDRRTHELFRTFGGLLDEAQLLARFNDQFAAECGWRGRGQMFAEPELHDETRSARHDEFVQRTDAFPWDRLQRFPEAADKLVFTEWRLPRDHSRERWTWLLEDLRRLFATLLINEIQDQHYTFGLWLPPSPAPHVELTFETRRGEEQEAARHRFRALINDADQALGSSARRGGTILPPEKLRRDTVLFYLRQMTDMSWNKLAHQYGRRGDQRKSVKDGYARARRLLSEIPA